MIELPLEVKTTTISSLRMAHRGSIQIIFNEKNLEAQIPIFTSLQRAGFEVSKDAEEPYTISIALDSLVDQTIVDILIPVINGLKYSRTFSLPKMKIRKRSKEIGREEGICDSVIRLGELISCIQALLQHNFSPPPSIQQALMYEDLVLYLNERQVYKGGKLVPVTPTTYRLLSFFIQRPGEVISKDTLLLQVWGFSNPSNDYNMVDTAIRRLRLEIEDNPKRPRYIQTIRGTGYQFGGPIQESEQ